jgi:hypothetical protein
MRIAEFIDRVKRHPFGKFIVRPSLAEVELSEVRQKWPVGALRDDLVALLQQANGIDFWVDEGSPDGYFRLLPFCEIDRARSVMWGEYADALSAEDVPYPHWLAISAHADGAAYIILDTNSHRYFLMDTCGADLTWPMGDNVEDLLSEIWEHWIEGMDV